MLLYYIIILNLTLEIAAATAKDKHLELLMCTQGICNSKSQKSFIFSEFLL